MQASSCTAPSQDVTGTTLGSSLRTPSPLERVSVRHPVEARTMSPTWRSGRRDERTSQIRSRLKGVFPANAISGTQLGETSRGCRCQNRFWRR
jgi:hypothetical protein